MNTVLQTYASDAGLALAQRTIGMLNAVPQGSRNAAFKALMKELDPRVAVEVAAARDRGYSIDKALQAGYKNMVERAVKSGTGLSGFKQDWAGLRGCSACGGLGNQNAPASSPTSGGASSTFGTGGPSMDQVTEGLDFLTRTANQIGDVIGAVGGAFGALTDAFGGGAGTSETAEEPVMAPPPTQISSDAQQIANLASRLRYTATASTGASVPYTWSLASLPTWSLALGAAVAAGATFWAVKKYVLKKGK